MSGEIEIGGVWKSKGKLIYTVIQIGKKFVWRVVHENGITETGIGYFDEKNTTKLHAEWNFHDGNEDSALRSARGEIKIDSSGNAYRIEWSDKDHFVKRLQKIKSHMHE